MRTNMRVVRLLELLCRHLTDLVLQTISLSAWSRRKMTWHDAQHAMPDLTDKSVSSTTKTWQKLLKT